MISFLCSFSHIEFLGVEGVGLGALWAQRGVRPGPWGALCVIPDASFFFNPVTSQVPRP